VKIKLVSDLHLEFSDINVTNNDKCDVLILGGDIMIAEDLHDHPNFDFNPYSHGAFADLGRKQQRVARFRDFLKRCAFQFPHVVYIAGNHEFYNGKWVKGIQYLRDECAKFPNVYFLERDMKTIDDVVFVGGTLWTDMNKGDPLTLHAVRDMMNDFRIIKNDDKGFTNLKPADTVVRHRETLQYIKHVVTEHKDKRCVVVGHHSPSSLSTHEQYRNEHLMNGAYHSDLSEFILDHPQIKLWTHGHTHHPFDYVIGETRIVCNPRGYESDGYCEDSGWNPNIVIEV
jgi:Icc-related predicted phosphoesterase